MADSSATATGDDYVAGLLDELGLGNFDSAAGTTDDADHPLLPQADIDVSLSCLLLCRRLLLTHFL